MIILVGPTAIGKTDLAIKLARTFSCEIVSMDSMQVYRLMNIGTAKPSPLELNQIQHHLIDIIDPDDQYDAARFITDATNAINSIKNKNKIPLLTGGTGLYLHSLLYGLFNSIPTDKTIRSNLLKQLKEEGREKLILTLQQIDQPTANRLHANDTQRLIRALEIFYLTGIPWSAHLEKQKMQTIQCKFENILQISLNCEREKLYERINSRASMMLDNGLIEEVIGLRNKGYLPSLSSMQSIGYKHANNFIDGTWNKEQTLAFLSRDTRHYAKRQITWFSKRKEMSKFNPNQEDKIFETLSNSLKRFKNLTK